MYNLHAICLLYLKFKRKNKESREQLMDYISSDRLQTYYDVFGTDPEYVKKAYYWNQQLCGSMYPMFQTLEVTFRNALCHHVPINHQNFTGDFWFQSLVNHIQDRRIKSLSGNDKQQWYHPNGRRKRWTAIEKIIYEMRREGKSSADVISNMNFGFWCKMLDTEYEDLTHKALLWPNMSVHVFPNYPSQFKFNRQYVFDEFKKARKLRNRVFHHEPVWKFQGYQQLSIDDLLITLNGRYDECLQIVSWISEEAYNEFIAFKLDERFKYLSSRKGLDELTS